ncbi:MAG TPA: Gfo/Idh/MocA family oxidoreductase [Dehalococcoidia bacterium]|nr:Gfo/Idh/MocA family oxidoreductase [Dehalococcoidia bacterium]
MRPRIGVIGAGLMGAAHGKSVHFCLKNGLIDGEFVALAEPDPERRAAYAARAGVSFVTADAAELIASPDVNTVYICTPTVHHKALALEALGRGKALFCEKPLAFNAGDAAVMAEAARKAGVTHQVGLVLRYAAVINVLRELLAAPEMGRPMTAVMVDDQYFPTQGRYASTWRGDARLVGAGTLLEHAIHDVDMLLWFFGPVTHVYGTTRHFFEKEGVEDVSNAVLEFASGVVVSHTSIWHNLLHRGSSRRLTLVCEDGQLGYEDDDWAGPVWTDTNALAERTQLSETEVVRRFVAQLELHGLGVGRLLSAVTPEYHGQDYLLEDYAFLRAVSEDRPASPDFGVAVEAHRVVDAVYASARSGERIALD